MDVELAKNLHKHGLSDKTPEQANAELLKAYQKEGLPINTNVSVTPKK